MQLKIVTRGGVQLASITPAQGSSKPLTLTPSGDAAQTTVEVTPAHGALHIIVAAPSSSLEDKTNATLDLPLRITTRERRRGWTRLACSSRRVLAYRLGQVILIVSSPDPANFLSWIDDDTPLGDLTLPGTHESCSFYGYIISQCQLASTPVAQQLLDGVRFFDVRLRVVGNDLMMYHGIQSQRCSFPILLDVFHAFLTAHPTETFILCLKEETPPWEFRFSARVYDAFEPYLNKFWHVSENVPKLGDVRGKGIVMTRFDRGHEPDEWPEGMGIHPSTWPDSRREGFAWDCAGTTVRTQDWYRISTFLAIPKKLDALISHLEPTLVPSTHPHNHPLTFSYSSAADLPLAPPSWIARGFGWPRWWLGVVGINDRLTRWLLDRVVEGKRVRACIPADFYRQAGTEETDLAALLVAMNFIETASLPPAGLPTITGTPIVARPPPPSSKSQS